MRFFPKLVLPTIKTIPDDILAKLGVEKVIVDASEIGELQARQETDVKRVRDKLLKTTEKFLTPYYPIEQLDLDNILAYRDYLINYENTNDWWKSLPMTLSEWNVYDNNLYE
jgi:adenosine deaminase